MTPDPKPEMTARPPDIYDAIKFAVDGANMIFNWNFRDHYAKQGFFGPEKKALTEKREQLHAMMMRLRGQKA